MQTSSAALGRLRDVLGQIPGGQPTLANGASTSRHVTQQLDVNEAAAPCLIDQQSADEPANGEMNMQTVASWMPLGHPEVRHRSATQARTQCAEEVANIGADLSFIVTTITAICERPNRLSRLLAQYLRTLVRARRAASSRARAGSGSGSRNRRWTRVHQAAACLRGSLDIARQPHLACKIGARTVTPTYCAYAATRAVPLDRTPKLTEAPRKAALAESHAKAAKSVRGWVCADGLGHSQIGGPQIRVV